MQFCRMKKSKCNKTRLIAGLLLFIYVCAGFILQDPFYLQSTTRRQYFDRLSNRLRDRKGMHYANSRMMNCAQIIRKNMVSG